MASRDVRNSSNKAAMELFKVVCQNGGVVELGQAVSSLSPRSKEKVQKNGAARFIETKYSKIFKLRREKSRVELEAMFPFAFCQEAPKGNCSNGNRCVKLHLCPYFVKGACMYKDKCRLSHNKRDVHTMDILRAVQLEDIDDSLLDVLLDKIVVDTEMERGASTHSIPDICKHYNNQGGCSKKDKCAFLHVCKYFVESECKFSNCKRIHDLTEDPHNVEVLKKFHLGRLSNDQVISLLRGRKCSSSSSDSSHQGSFHVNGSVGKHQPSNQAKVSQQFPAINLSQGKPQFHQAAALSTKQDAEICGFYLKGQCNYGNKCVNLHRDLPYQWQFQGSSTDWEDFPAYINIIVEQHYCSLAPYIPKVDINHRPYHMNFDEMMAKPLGVTLAPKLSLRRVSTKSSEEAPPGHIFSTHWKWYWKDEHDNWQSYDSPDDGVAVNTTCSKSLEKEYLQGKSSHPFSAGLHSYTLSFDEMFQRNDRYMTERDVLRRPEFVPKDKMKEIAQKRKDDLKLMIQRSKSASSLTSSDTGLPPHWSSMDDRDFCLEQLSVTSTEYKDVESKFLSTMAAPKRIVKIERLQNPDLWTAYVQKKARMQSRAAGKAPQEQLQLFHGTSPDVRNAICQQGFDWRMCGKHGVVYGQGSYFACVASYSHKYASPDPSNMKYMFIAKVLVGEYAVGNKSLTRPPPKDPSNPYGELYDSCVNDETNPSIFVIFENSQAYPEFMITYM